uniref:YadA-like family protein n=1 Tax=Bartonella sp. CB178 TaxID=3112255 RepID=UPI00300E65E6
NEFTKLDNKFTDLDGKIDGVKSDFKDNLLAKYNKGDKSIFIGSDVDGAVINVSNKNSGSRKILGVADGDISVSSSEAVNGSQLHSLGDVIAKSFGGSADYQNGRWVAPRFDIVQFGAHGLSSGKESYYTVSDAFGAVNDNFESLSDNMRTMQDDIIGSVGQNSISWDSNEHAFVASHVTSGVKTNGKLKFLLDGSVFSGSTEAVTGGQLYNVNKTIAEYLGGGSKFENGNWVAPNFKVSTLNADGVFEDTDYTNVASALGSISSSFKNVGEKVKNDVVSELRNDVVGGVTSQVIQDIKTEVNESSLVQHDVSTNVISIGGNVGGSEITVGNSSTGLRTISGVKAASLTAMSTEAVTGSQLYSMSNALASYFGDGVKYEGGEWVIPSFTVTELNEDGTSSKHGYTNVASALEGMSSSFENLTQSVMNNIVEGITHEDLVTSVVDGVKNEITVDIADELKDDVLLKIGNDITDNVTKEIRRTSVVKQEEFGSAINIGKDMGGVEITVVNNEGALRAISGVKAASLTASSTEAVNGSQLFSVSNKLASYFDGSAKYENGEWMLPEFRVVTIDADGVAEDTNYTNVAAALDGMSSSFRNVGEKVKNDIVSELKDDVVGGFTAEVIESIKADVGKLSLVQQDASANIITIGGKVAGTEVTVRNRDGELRSISGVKSASIGISSTEAVNGSQLYSLNNQLASYFGGGAKYENEKWVAPAFNVVQLDGTVARSGKDGVRHTVASAFDAVNESILSMNSRIDGIENKIPNASGSGIITSGDLVSDSDNVGHNGQLNKITNVADGKVVSGSQDAVNGGQLWETNEKVAQIEEKVGNSVAYDVDKDGHKFVSLGGDDSEPVLLDNVADGKVEEGSKEAVNGGQLASVLGDAKKYTDQRLDGITADSINDAVGQSQLYTDMKFEALSYGIENNQKEARQAAAIGLAVSNLRYDDTPGRLSVSFGSGLWRSQSAFALGAGYTSEDGNVRSNLSVTSSGGHWGVGVGVTFTLN